MRRIAGRCWWCFQAMDAAGKDGVIKHVMSGVNPQGCQVHAVQGAERRRSSTTISCGARDAAAGARPHRHFQPLATTRKCWWCACIPEILAAAEAAGASS